MRRASPRYAPLLAGVLIWLCTSPAAALAGGGDAAATRAYVSADLALARAANARLRTAERAPGSVLAHVRSACPHAAEGSPQNEESAQLREEVIGAMVHAASQPDLAAMRAFARAVAPLRWSSARVTRAVQDYARSVRTLASLPAPDLCGDVRAWAASGFRVLPTSTLSYVARFDAAWVRLGELVELPRSLRATQSAGVLRQSHELEANIADAEARDVETWASIMNELSLEP